VTPNDKTSDGTTVQSNNITIEKTGNVSFGKFDGDSTDFNLVEDPDNVSDATLEISENGSITWNTPINATNQNFDAFVVIGQGFVSVDTDNLNPTINSSSNISMNGVSCPISVITRAAGVHTTVFSVQGNGSDCIASGICSNVVCSGSTLNFTVSEFTGFAAGANANLTIDNNGPKNTDVAITFNASYVNASSGALITGATCNISFDDLTALMSETSFIYEFDRSFSTDGTFNYSVDCAAASFSSLTATDNVSVSAVAPSAAGGGRGGGGGAILLELPEIREEGVIP